MELDEVPVYLPLVVTERLGEHLRRAVLPAEELPDCSLDSSSSRAGPAARTRFRNHLRGDRGRSPPVPSRTGCRRPEAEAAVPASRRKPGRDRLRRPAGESDPSTRTRDPRHRAIAGWSGANMMPHVDANLIEAPVLELERLDITDAVVDLQAALLGSPLRLLDQRGRQVDAHDVCAGGGEPRPRRSRPAGKVEKALTRLRPQPSITSAWMSVIVSVIPRCDPRASRSHGAPSALRTASSASFPRLVGRAYFSAMSDLLRRRERAAATGRAARAPPEAAAARGLRRPGADPRRARRCGLRSRE